MGMCEKTEWLRSCEGTSLTLVQLRLQSPKKFYKKTKKKSCTKLDPAFVSHLDDLSLPKKTKKKQDLIIKTAFQYRKASMNSLKKKTGKKNIADIVPVLRS